MEYPLLQISRAGYIEVDNISQYRAELRECSPNLFISDSINVDLELLTLPKRKEVGASSCCPDSIPGADEVERSTRLNIRSQDELKAVLKNEEMKSKTCIYLISQQTSWSRLKITREMFESLCAVHEIFPKFLNIVFGFGRKTSSVAEYFVGCYARFMGPESTQEEDKQKLFQICYDLRYYELHGRDLEDPWSCRRSAIYQKFNPEKDQSLWILIQASKQFKQELVDLLETSPGLSDHPMMLHLRYLISCGKNWRVFLTHINEQLSLLDRKMVGPERYEDFGVNFGVSQKLQRIKCRLNQARSILSTTIDITTVISSHSITLQSFAKVSPTLEQAFQNELQQVTLDLRKHARMVEEMLGFSEDLRLMVGEPWMLEDDFFWLTTLQSHKILEFWNGDLIQENGRCLRQLAFSEAIERKLLSQLAQETRKDSKRMKIATVIATCYLPTNLVLAFFSTNLVRLDDSESGLTIRAQIWAALVMIVVLIVITFGVASYWHWWRRGEHRSAGTSEQPQLTGHE